LLVAGTTPVRAQSGSPARADATLADGRKVVLQASGRWEFGEFAGLSQVHLSGALSAEDLRIADLLRCRVLEVIDGGTLRVALAEPRFPLAARETVRLAGARAPDLRTMDLFAFESREALAGRVTDGELFLAPDRPLRDESGRLRAYLYTAEGTCLNTILVREGFLRVGRVTTHFADELTALQGEARERRRGLWGGVARKVHIREVFNAGTREYVEIANASAVAVDLSGWVLSGDRGEVVALPLVVLDPSETVRIYTGQDGRHDPPKAYYSLAREVWDGRRDTIRLFDPDGVLVDLLSYPTR
jgi:endonuclease YncB( thermonuclease family)